MGTPAKHTMGTSTPKHNSNTRNNHYTKNKYQTHKQKQAHKRLAFSQQSKQPLLTNSKSLSTKQNVTLQLLVLPMLLPLSKPLAMDTVVPQRAQTKGNPITTSNETSNLSSSFLQQYHCGPYEIQQT